MVAYNLAYIKEKWAHTGFQRYLKNTSWIFFVKIASILISLLATAIIARKLGPSNYGQLSYALSFTAVFSFIASLGIDQILYRDIIKYPEQKNKYIGSALIMKIAAGLVTFCICVITAFFFSVHDISFLLIIIIAFSFIFNSFQLINFEFHADVKAKYPSIVSLIVIIILNVLKITVIFLDKGVLYLAFIILLEPILYMIGLLYYRRKIYGTIKNWKFDKHVALLILKDSWPLIFSSAFISIYSRIDQVMIKNMMDAHSVGLYSASVSISEAWYFLPNIIVGSILPAVINAKKVSEGMYYQRIKKLLIVLLLVSVGTALFTIIFSPLIISIIYGKQFLSAVPVLNIYVLSNIATSVVLLITNYLIIENHRKALLILPLSGAILNVILNIFLIPKFGITGAAWATAISYTLSIASIFIFKLPRIAAINILKKNVD